MSDEPRQTYTARDIVLEFFPATHERLVPGTDDHRLERGPQGQLHILSHDHRLLLYLSPVAPAGPQVQLCCDFCQKSAPRAYLQHFRAEFPGSQGRRYRYVCLCRDTVGCELRRLNDRPIRALLERLGR